MITTSANRAGEAGDETVVFSAAFQPQPLKTLIHEAATFSMEPSNNCLIIIPFLCQKVNFFFPGSPSSAVIYKGVFC